MSDSNGVNPIVIVLVAGSLLLVAGGAVLFLWGGAPRVVAVGVSSGASAFQGYRCERHADETLASSEVTLAIDGRELVRRAVWGSDGALDAQASGFFIAGARVRPLSEIEVQDLAQLAAVKAVDLHRSMPSSLLAKD